MANGPSKSVELYRLKASNFSDKLAPNQKEYYERAADWLEEQQFETLEEATAAMRNTEYYEGASIAMITDDIRLRIRAAEEVGYDDVAQVHTERLRKYKERGNSYAFSQEWIDDLNLAAEKSAVYARRKELFGRIFSGYFEIAGNPQSDHRKRAAEDMRDALKELDSMGVSFDELASQRAYRQLTMMTDKGMDRFIDFIHEFSRGAYEYDDDMSDPAEEQERLGRWAASNRDMIMAAGKCEKWMRASCVAVPSDAPEGYDFIALKEVKL